MKKVSGEETLNAMNVQFYRGEVVHFFSERKTDENNPQSGVFVFDGVVT